jgi:hypothetical protein
MPARRSQATRALVLVAIATLLMRTPVDASHKDSFIDLMEDGDSDFGIPAVLIESGKTYSAIPNQPVSSSHSARFLYNSTLPTHVAFVLMPHTFAVHVVDARFARADARTR